MLRRFGPALVLAHRDPLSSTTYVIRSGGSDIIVDPGLLSEEEARLLAEAIEADEAIIVHTHMHYDHVASTPVLIRLLRGRGVDVTVAHHEAEAEMLARGDSAATVAYLFGAEAPRIEVDIQLRDGDKLPGGVLVIHTPGHTIGSICLLIEKHLFTGDTLFADGSPGRFDLPTGSRKALVKSLARLERVDAEAVLPGHGLPRKTRVGQLARRARAFI